MRQFGRVAALAVLALVAAVPGVAGGQTTTTTATTSTTSTTATTSTTLVPATTTTTVHRCAGQPCSERPPAAVFSAASGQVTADQGGSCWVQPTSPVGVCTAVSRPIGYRPPMLVVTQGEVVTIRFVAPVQLQPTGLTLREGQEQIITLPVSNPTSFRADFAPGAGVVLSLDTRWLQGDASYVIGLDVRPAGRSITLTG